MSATVELPYWVLLLVLGFAAVAALDRILVPSARWFLRRRMQRAVDRINQKLSVPIEPFKLMRRQDQVIRLIYDPQVMEAVTEFAREQGVPQNIAFERARSYAREIVPGFSTATYFGFATKLAQKISQGLYSVHLGGADSPALQSIDKRAAVVFVINHRSNMDYVLVTWLASKHSALSYAVGEWARIWPLKALIRAMGAYFIRRRYSNNLYRAVLARYVQMSVQQGTTQAIFPEGGLSLDGTVGKARLGLLRYIVQDFSPDSGRDVVFVPVAVNYDRVLEDRVLIAAQRAGSRRFPVQPRVLARFVWGVMWKRVRGRFERFGHAAVCYGAPLSLRDHLRSNADKPVDTLAQELMARIRMAVPVLPVPLAAAMLCRQDGPQSRAELGNAAAALVETLHQRGCWLHLPAGDVAEALDEGLRALLLRGLITRTDAGFEPVAEERGALEFYAASVLQRDALPGTDLPRGLTLPSPAET
ncbi:1-acyl-sn-glycerol-3-phosphate acyltransferase [Rhodobacteraceae bacterium 2376]|uniref:Glycerol-3-phosphate acyltransferase n=1 Tax=Rhabdonatronobacter sediminivivens TaxID=2743469 RepID=A0A7Z0KWP6_9RHOB|nr:1-acyl-sn-glycerol-3-phosphate acyltransferase [Rhabdonatronobacter sediminivivens]NYS23765.1 1-acyl-sn-glycerol-3-phosphate acyltransferase [Rhabdonatronobacter sediminivivens]